MPGLQSQFTEDPDAIWLLVHFIEDASERRRRGLPPMDVEPSVENAPAAEAVAPVENSSDDSAEDASNDESVEVINDDAAADRNDESAN